MQPNYTHNNYAYSPQNINPFTANAGFDEGQPINWSSYKEVRSIFGSNQKNIVLFAYNKHKDENSPQQIMVLQQPKKKIKGDTPNQFSHDNSLVQSSQVEEKLFLRKVDQRQKAQIAEQIKQMMSFSNQLTLQQRYERRKEIFESSKGRRQCERASEQVLANRMIRIVKMDSLIEGGSIRGVVQLGAKPVEYEVLNLNQSQQEYYTLVKKVVRANQVFPQIIVEKNQFLSEISYEPDQPIKEYQDYGDDYDSNDSDNPNFDYPDEQGSERSSQQIIPQDYNSENEFDEEMIEDQEQVYRRYLRRERKKEMERREKMDVQDQYEDF